MDVDLALRLAYALNILILIPVVASLWRAGPGGLPVFQGTARNEPALTRLVAALWTAILICSVVGLFAPRLMLGVMILQVIYKTLYLALQVAPNARRGVPWGIATSFIVIVAVWPGLIWWALSAS